MPMPMPMLTLRSVDIDVGRWCSASFSSRRRYEVGSQQPRADAECLYVDFEK